MWVRGLKHLTKNRMKTIYLSHPMWVRGLKLPKNLSKHEVDGVAPYVGAWIETTIEETN